MPYQERRPFQGQHKAELSVRDITKFLFRTTDLALGPIPGPETYTEHVRGILVSLFDKATLLETEESKALPFMFRAPSISYPALLSDISREITEINWRNNHLHGEDDDSLIVSSERLVALQAVNKCAGRAYVELQQVPLDTETI